MNITLGSTSADKTKILEATLKGHIPVWQISSARVDSGVSDQPLSIEETTQGAINRAKLAFSSDKNTDLGVGMEAGLEKVGGILRLVCVVAFWDGECLILGRNNGLPLPEKVSNQIKEGDEFGKVIRAYQKEAPEDEQERVSQLISREASFRAAIERAIPQLRQRVGKQGVDSVISLLSPRRLHFNIAHPLLMISLITSILYFTLGNIIIFISVYSFRHHALNAVNLLATISLATWALSLYITSSHPRFAQSNQIRRLFRWSIAATLFIIPIQTLPSLLTGSFSTLSLLHLMGSLPIMAAIPTIITILIYIMLFQVLQNEALLDRASYKIVVWTIPLGLIMFIASNWTVYAAGDIPPPLIRPVFVLGLVWAWGQWVMLQSSEKIMAKGQDGALS